jgi:PAS domain S-box-containing protein
MSLPAYAMWKDESFGIPNKALLRLLSKEVQISRFDQRQFLSLFRIWSEDFKREYSLDEFPIIELCRTQKAFHGRRIGMKDPETGSNIIFEINGEPVLDDKTGEFIGGLVVLNDVTEYIDKISGEVEANQKQWEYAAELGPVMFWTTTPTGLHDWFSRRWYDYTGLTKAESMGEGWRLPFHPDDMTLTSQRWGHSLRTGDDYITEYRCRRRDGEWRWMLGRAVPFFDSQGKIVKWFGTCTDIHDLVEARQEAKQTRDQLLRVIEHTHVMLWVINREEKIVLLEGNTIGRPDGTSFDRSSAFGKDVHEAFGFTPAPDDPKSLASGIKAILGEGTRKDTAFLWPATINGRSYRSRLVPLWHDSRDGIIEGEPYVDGIIGITVDITGMLLVARELTQD